MAKDFMKISMCIAEKKLVSVHISAKLRIFKFYGWGDMVGPENPQNVRISNGLNP